jgi:Polyketide cyclase / dehydrase and lipid transport
VLDGGLAHPAEPHGRALRQPPAVHQAPTAELAVRLGGGIEESAAGPDLAASIAHPCGELVGHLSSTTVRPIARIRQLG